MRQKSAQLYKRACELFPGGVNSPVRAFRSVDQDPFFVERGAGAYLIDADGNRYVDYVCSWGPLVLGHADPRVVSKLTEQLSKGTTYGACSALEAELALQIKTLMPNLEMLRFVNSGTEAALSVIRLARAYTKRSKILKFAGCYHGHVDSLLVQAGSGVATLGIPDCAGVTPELARETISVGYNDLDAVSAAFSMYGSEIAAVIVEPVVGNAGLIQPVPGFLEGLRSITTKHEALLIFDEVMTGFRVALGGAQALFKIEPDLTMLGKVIGGGLPVGAFGGRREIMQLIAPLGPVYQAGTLSGNPLAMVAGAATLAAWKEPGVFERTAGAAKTLAQALSEIARESRIPLCSSAVGTMFGFFFQAGPVTNYNQAKLSDIARFKRFFTLMLEGGVYFAPSQFEAGFVSTAHLGTPLDETIRVLPQVFKQL